MGTDSMISLKEGIGFSMDTNRPGNRLTKNIRCWTIDPGEFVT